MADIIDVYPMAPAPPLGLRDYFATAAMQALASAKIFSLGEAGNKYVAEAAYNLADAMLAERDN